MPTFYDAVQGLDPLEVTQLANTRPNAGEYLLAGILPPINKPTYDAKSGTMRVVSTMAGMVGMDSPYPEGSFIDASDFREGTLKIAQAVSLDEGTIREVQMVLREAQLAQGGGADPAAILQGTALNLYEKGVLQALDDTEEWLRAQALTTGEINWTFGKNTVNVDYEIPTENRPAQVTGVNSYGGGSSAFWSHVRLARKRLRSVRAFLTDFDTLDMIIDNDAHKITVVNEVESAQGNIRTVTLRRAVRNAEGITVGFDQDVRGTVTLVGYGREGRVIAPAAPGGLATVQFVPTGTMVAIGNNNVENLIALDGNPNVRNALGYTHVAPTVENGGATGRWGRIYTPQERPWKARAEGVANVMPVIEDPSKLMIFSTEVS